MIHFSPSKLGFYPEELLELYQDAGTLPDDLVQLTDEEVAIYQIGTNPEGMKIAATSEGRPTWVSVEVTADDVRTKRDFLLRDTDWWAVADRTMTPEQIAYRQALRDVTSQEGFPTAVVWPTKPE